MPRNTGSTSESSTGSGSESAHGTGEVALRLSSLQALHTKSEDGDTSAYSRNGCDSSRLQELLRHPGCSCKCTMPFKVLEKICKCFWKLPKENQDALLWTLQCEAGSRGRNKFSIEGLG